MPSPTIETGMYVPPNPPWGVVRAITALARWGGLSSVFVWDHFQEFYPTVLWDEMFTPFSARVSSPHEVFDYQTLLGALAARAGKMRLGVGVSEPIRRHPVLLAQAALTLAHLTGRAPILGLGCGEKMNTEPYGLSQRRAVDRLAEALQIVRRCLDSRGPFDFAGAHFRLDGAVMDLQAPPGRSPEVWVAAHWPRMLELTGRYGDGWLPMTIALNTPDEYAAKLARIRSAARDAGRDPDRIVPALFAYVLVAPTQKRAQAMLHSRMVRYWAFAVLRRALDSRRGGPSFRLSVPRFGRHAPGTLRPDHTGEGTRGGTSRGRREGIPRRHTGTDRCAVAGIRGRRTAACGGRSHVVLPVGAGLGVHRPRRAPHRRSVAEVNSCPPGRDRSGASTRCRETGSPCRPAPQPRAHHLVTPPHQHRQREQQSQLPRRG